MAKFAKETDLCAAFTAAVARDNHHRPRAERWTVYAETGGFDLVAARADGLQIGIEAKLSLNLDVLRQALPDPRPWAIMMPGPDLRAVLVPAGAVKPNGLWWVAEHFGLTVIRVEERASPYSVETRIEFAPELPSSANGYQNHWMDWAPWQRITLPDYVPDVTGGASAPVKLTPWKVAAIKLLILLKRRPVTRADFKHLGLDARRWIDRRGGWLEAVPGGWVAGNHTPPLLEQHPTNSAEIEADFARWAPAVPSSPVPPPPPAPPAQLL